MRDDGQVSDVVIGWLVRLLRLHLGLDVAFVSELDEHWRVFRYVDTDLVASPVAVGGVDPASQSCCRYVVDGRLPQFLADAAAHPVSAALPATRQLPVGTHLSVPIRLSDGTPYGTLCSFALAVRDGLDEGDLAVVRLLADAIASDIEQRDGHHRQHPHRHRRLQAIDGDDDGVEMVFQPIIDLSDHTVVGVEALAGLPAGAYLAVNVSSATLTSPAFADAIDGVASDRLVVQVSEHARRGRRRRAGGCAGTTQRVRRATGHRRRRRRRVRAATDPAVAPRPRQARWRARPRRVDLPEPAGAAVAARAGNALVPVRGGAHNCNACD